MTSEQLIFSALQKRMDEMPKHSSHQLFSSRRAVWGNGIGLAAGLAGLILGKMLPATFTTAIVTAVMLIVEIIAFALAWTAELPSLNLRPSRERKEFAETLDFDLPNHFKLITWLQRFPRERLELMREFSTHRLDRMRSKLPLLTGSIEKLGVLPLVGALFLQLGNLHWLLQLHWPQILLIAFLMLGYWTGMLQLSLRFRLELYDALLSRALGNQISEDSPHADSAESDK